MPTQKEVEAENAKLKAEIDELKEELAQANRVAFWRMCEAYNDFNKHTDLFDFYWRQGMRSAIEEHHDKSLGSVEELHEGYCEWIGDPPSDDDD